jgi:hypothetical protein
MKHISITAFGKKEGMKKRDIAIEKAKSRAKVLKKGIVQKRCFFSDPLFGEVISYGRGLILI